jgi:hypothetical protein
MISVEQARAAKPRALDIFRRLAPVLGVGVTRVNHGYALKVNLARVPESDVVLPTEVDGVPVHVEIVGRIRKRTPG